MTKALVPKVSVVLPTRDRAYCLPRALRSVLTQDMPDWELILVDDGSSDGTPALRAHLAAVLGPNNYREVETSGLGPAGARNRGLALARGEFVAFLDSDDAWLPQKLGMQLSALARDPAAGFCFTDFSEFGDDGSFSRERHLIPRAMEGCIYPAVLQVIHNVITTPSVMVRRNLLEQVGGFDESMRICEDIDLWTRLARRSRCAVIRVPLTLVHAREALDFPYVAGLTGRQQLYRRARAADPALDTAFLVELYVEILDSYLAVALQRGDAHVARALEAALAIARQCEAAAQYSACDATMDDLITQLRR